PVAFRRFNLHLLNSFHLVADAANRLQVIAGPNSVETLIYFSWRVHENWESGSSAALGVAAVRRLHGASWRAAQFCPPAGLVPYTRSERVGIWHQRMAASPPGRSP